MNSRYRSVVALCIPLAIGATAHAQGRTVVVRPGGGPAVAVPVQPRVPMAQPVYRAPRQPVMAQPVYRPPPVAPARPVVVNPAYPHPGMGRPLPPGPIVVAPPGPPVGPWTARPLPPPGIVGRPVVVGRPPPPPVRDPFVPAMRPGQVWVPGFWRWTGGDYVWITGHWEVPPTRGYVWIGPRWTQFGVAFQWTPGYWSTPEWGTPSTWNRGTFGLPIAPQPYQVGSIVTGILEPGDYHTPGSGYVDDYAVWLTAGATVTFQVRGGPTPTGQRLDVVASLLHRGRLVMTDDDGAGYPDAQLIITPPTTGIYGLRISTATHSYQTGAYTIQSWVGPAALGRPVDVMPPNFGLSLAPR
jgi:hypothetical protein